MSSSMLLKTDAEQPAARHRWCLAGIAVAAVFGATAFRHPEASSTTTTLQQVTAASAHVSAGSVGSSATSQSHNAVRGSTHHPLGVRRPIGQSEPTVTESSHWGTHTGRGAPWSLGAPLTAVAALVGVWWRRQHKQHAMAAWTGAAHQPLTGIWAGSARQPMVLGASPDPFGVPSPPRGTGSLQQDRETAVTPQPNLQPKTLTGELLQYALENSPDQFEAFLRERIHMLSDERAKLRDDIKQRRLYQRIGEVKGQEQRTAVEDILYCAVLHEFVVTGVTPIAPAQLRGAVALPPAPHSLQQRCAPTAQEQELVDTHMKYCLGPFAARGTSKLAKYHAFEIFGTSLLFGYFLRRESARFALARSTGIVSRVMTTEDQKEMLEELFNRADSTQAVAPTSAEPRWGHELTLKEYVDTLDMKELKDSMFMSQEAASVVQSYVMILFGDVVALAQQLKTVMEKGGPIQSAADHQRLMLEAIDNEHVELLTISLDSLQRLVLDAIAFGVFLKDAEATVELTAEHRLLSPAAFLDKC